MESKKGTTAATAATNSAKTTAANTATAKAPGNAADKDVIRKAVEHEKAKASGPAHTAPAPATGKAPSAAANANNCCAEMDYANKIQDLTDTLKRVQADFENHVKQVDKRAAQQCEHASAHVLLKVLYIVDDFERALITLENAKIDVKLLEGMMLVNKNIHGVLEAEGVRPIECVGKTLDPFRHEVLRRVKKDGVKEDIVLEEHVKGYMLKDKVLRFAKVTVAHNGD
jgi:molecular chaperone GrpE (heat shock protein)